MVTGQWTSGQKVKEESQHTMLVWAEPEKVSPIVRTVESIILVFQQWYYSLLLIVPLVEPHLSVVLSVHVG